MKAINEDKETRTILTDRHKANIDKLIHNLGENIFVRMNSQYPLYNVRTKKSFEKVQLFLKGFDGSSNTRYRQLKKMSTSVDTDNNIKDNNFEIYQTYTRKVKGTTFQPAGPAGSRT